MVGSNLITTQLLNGVGKSSILLVQMNSNCLNGALFKELNNVLDDIERWQGFGDIEEKIDGVIFTSVKKKIFLAGADLFQLESILSETVDTALKDKMLETVIEGGQDTFTRIEKLKVPTVAAIQIYLQCSIMETYSC